MVMPLRKAKCIELFSLPQKRYCFLLLVEDTVWFKCCVDGLLFCVMCNLIRQKYIFTKVL